MYWIMNKKFTKKHMFDEKDIFLPEEHGTVKGLPFIALY